jgi:hypothetical protein
LNEKYNAVSWDTRESSLIDNTNIVAKEVWAHILKIHNVIPQKKERDKMSLFENYYPVRVDDTHYREEPYKREPRVISMENNDGPRRVGKAFGSMASIDS